jgi:hypothetical protein
MLLEWEEMVKVKRFIGILRCGTKNLCKNNFRCLGCSNITGEQSTWGYFLRIRRSVKMSIKKLVIEFIPLYDQPK